MFPSLFGHERILICLCPGTISIVDLSKGKLVQSAIPEDVMRFGNITDPEGYGRFITDLLRLHLHPQDTCAIALGDGLAFRLEDDDLDNGKKIGSALDMDVPLASETMVTSGHLGKRHACGRDVFLPIVLGCRALGGNVTIVFPISAMDPVPSGKNMLREVGQRFLSEQRNLRSHDFLRDLGENSITPSPRTGSTKVQSYWLRKTILATTLIAATLGGGALWFEWNSAEIQVDLTQSGSLITPPSAIPPVPFSPTPLPLDGRDAIPSL